MQIIGKHEFVSSVAVAAVSLVTAAVCHRFLPGWGAMLKPLLWPLLLLSLGVRLRLAAVTAFVVPLASALVNGMPTWSCALTLAALSVAGTVAIAGIRLAIVRALRGRKLAE